MMEISFQNSVNSSSSRELTSQLNQLKELEMMGRLRAEEAKQATKLL